MCDEADLLWSLKGELAGGASSSSRHHKTSNRMRNDEFKSAAGRPRLTCRLETTVGIRWATWVVVQPKRVRKSSSCVQYNISRLQCFVRDWGSSTGMNPRPSNRPPLPAWTLITSHGLVLLHVAAHESPTIREMAENLDLTERRIAAIILDLRKAGLVQITRIGRRNHYSLDPKARFRHPYVANIPFASFLELWQQAVRLEHGQQELSSN